MDAVTSREHKRQQLKDGHSHRITQESEESRHLLWRVWLKLQQEDGVINYFMKLLSNKSDLISAASIVVVWGTYENDSDWSKSAR